MGIQLLREYLREAALAELRVDHAFLDKVYRLTGISLPGRRSTATFGSGEFRWVAEQWLDDVEHELRRPLLPRQRDTVIRFVDQRMLALVKRFGGNIDAAEQTMKNLLNARFNLMRPSSR